MRQSLRRRIVVGAMAGACAVTAEAQARPNTTVAKAAARGWQPGMCVRLRYTPDSLERYLPITVRLSADRWWGWTASPSRRAQLANWTVAPGVTDGTAAWTLFRGNAGWYTTSDTLVVEYGGDLIGDVLGRVRLRWNGPRDVDGRALFTAGGDIPVPATGTVYGERAPCDSLLSR